MSRKPVQGLEWLTGISMQTDQDHVERKSVKRKKRYELDEKDESESDEEYSLQKRQHKQKKKKKKIQRDQEQDLTKGEQVEEKEDEIQETEQEKSKRIHKAQERQLHWLAEGIDYEHQKDKNKHIELGFDKKDFKAENWQSVDASFLESAEALDPQKIQRSMERERKIWSATSSSDRAGTSEQKMESGSSSSIETTDVKLDSSSMMPFVEDLQFVNPLRSQTTTLKQCYGKERTKNISQKSLQDIFDILTADPRNNDFCEGDSLIELANQLLDSFKQERSADQVDIHNAVLTALEPQIYGQDFDAKRIEILKKQQRLAFVCSCLIMTPRRWGKTMAIAMIISVLLYVARRIQIVVFATSNVVDCLVLKCLLQVKIFLRLF